jgi:CoA transferase family III
MRKVSAPSWGVEPLELRRFLDPVIEVPPGAESFWDGPRWWWHGPLDVEGLALGAAGALIAGLNALDESRDSRRSTTSELLAASFNSIGCLRIAGAPPQAWAPMSGFRATKDGWVRLHANYPHHAERLTAALDITSPEQLDAALLERGSLEVEQAVQAAGGVAAAVRTPGEWRASPMGTAAMPQPWIEFTLGAAGSRVAQPGRSAQRPLDGVRVLDFTRVIAGPSATRLLGALGADVLRIDAPQLPELTDQHVDTGFAKRSALADLGDPEQLARVRELLPLADVVFLGYRTGALRRFGLAPEALRDEHPDLIVVSVNAWGSAGPWADTRGFDSIVQAACGIAHLYGGERNGAWRPGALPVQALDHATGLGLAGAALALLAARRRGVTGSARLSLIATAHALLRSAAPDPAPGPVELTVPRRQTPSPYGVLDYVPPPLRIDGRSVEYTHAPVRYGSSELDWLEH